MSVKVITAQSNHQTTQLRACSGGRAKKTTQKPQFLIRAFLKIPARDTEGANANHT